ncbi:MAG: leucine-rich repeat protein [Clostridia bacterium]|nr:leucine-rich repeat protein [Clostridia bacterium]
MKKTRKLLIALLSVILCFATVLCITSCKKKPKENEKHYFLTFSYDLPDSSEPQRIDVQCSIGEVITAPEYPQYAGVRFNEWNSSERPDFTVGSGEQFTVTEDMFYEGAKNTGPDGNWDEYYGSFGLWWEYENYTATVHGYDGFSTEIEFSIESDEGIYDQASHTLLSSLVDFNYYSSGKVENVYRDGYVFDGWYLDENYQTPLALQPSFAQNVDVYAKWTYVGLYFEFGRTYDYDKEEHVFYYTLTKIDNNQSISTLTIPETCNYLPVLFINSNVHQGSATIDKLILPDTITNIPAYAFSSGLINEIVIGDNAIFEENAFADSNAKLTLSSSNPNYLVRNNVLYDLRNKNVHSILSTPSGDVVVPDGIVSFGTAFANSTITSIRIPLSVTQIDNGAFENCSSLAWAIMHGDYDKGVNSIGQNAFKNCSALGYVVLSRDLATVGENAFYGCDSLEFIYFGGEYPYEWTSIQKDNSCLDVNPYFYSASEQTIDDYSSYIRWHYDANDMPVTWLTVKNNLAGKTFEVTSAEVTVSDYYWNLIVTAKEHDILDQYFSGDIYEAALISSTKAEFETALGQIYGNQLAICEFGTDGIVKVTNDLGTDIPFTYVELNDRIIFKPYGHSGYPKGTFYVDEDGNVYEIQQADKIESNETITVRYNYTEVA